MKNFRIFQICSWTLESNWKFTWKFSTSKYKPCWVYFYPEAEFKEFEQRLKFKPRLKYGWFHIKLYSMFQDLSQRSIETGFWRI